MNGNVMTCPGFGGRTLSSALSEATLDLAVDSRAPVFIGGEDHAGGALAGTIAGGDEKSLHLRIPRWNSGASVLSGLSELEMTMVVGGRRYAFSTRPLDPPPLSSSDVLLVARPTNVSVLDRRRSRRRDLRSASSVTLRRIGGKGHWSCRAPILNVSPDGLACRADMSDAQQIPVGTDVVSEFQVESEEEAFQFSGCVVNSTRAGSPDQVVLGIEFLPNESSTLERERLRQLFAGETD